MENVSARSVDWSNQTVMYKIIDRTKGWRRKPVNDLMNYVFHLISTEWGLIYGLLAAICRLAESIIRRIYVVIYYNR